MDWLITQTKGSPVNNKEVFGPEFSKGPHCFLRVHVTGSHKPSWFIGTELKFDRSMGNSFPFSRNPSKYAVSPAMKIVVPLAVLIRNEPHRDLLGPTKGLRMVQ